MIKYLFLLICCVIFVSCTYSNNSIINFETLNKEKSFIIFRGTKTKQGFYARDFNIKDTLSSHVGLLMFKKGIGWRVFHVSDYNDIVTDFREMSIVSFLNEEEKITSASVWEVNISKRIKLLNELESYHSKKIIFDKYFSLKDSTRLYCSEFVCNVLKKVDSSKYNYPFEQRELKGIYKTYFRRDTLKYYPVDIFQFDRKNIKKALILI